MEIKIQDTVIPAEACEQHIQATMSRNPGLSREDAEKEAQKLIVEQEVLRIHAMEQFPQIPKKEVEQQFNEVMTKSGGKDAFLKQYNMSESDLPKVKNDIRERLRFTKFLDQLAADADEPTEEEIVKFHADNPEIFGAAAKVHVAHILKQYAPQQWETTHAEMCGIRKRVLDGEDFAAVANEVSDAKEEGGDLGLCQWQDLDDEFACVVFSLAKGDISPVFHTRKGMEIAKVIDRKEKGPAVLDECRDQVINHATYSKRNEAIQQWLDATIAEMDITVS